MEGKNGLVQVILWPLCMPAVAFSCTNPPHTHTNNILKSSKCWKLKIYCKFIFCSQYQRKYSYILNMNQLLFSFIGNIISYGWSLYPHPKQTQWDTQTLIDHSMAFTIFTVMVKLTIGCAQGVHKADVFSNLPNSPPSRW